MDAGQWPEAAEHLALALATIDEHRLHDYAWPCWRSPAAARLALHRGDLEDTNRQLARGMRPGPSCHVVLPGWLCGSGCSSPRCTSHSADTTTARHLLREIDDILRPPAEPGHARRRGVRAPAELAATVSAGAAGGPPLSPAELRLLPYLQTHLTLPEIASRLFVSHNTVRSQVGSIYRKLGVSSRSDAVGHATTIGLLGG